MRTGFSSLERRLRLGDRGAGRGCRRSDDAGPWCGASPRAPRPACGRGARNRARGSSNGRSSGCVSSRSVWPISSSRRRTPIVAMISRTSSAIRKRKVMAFSGVPTKRLLQHRVLRGDADRAGVQVALAHHDAADGDQRRGGEAELVGPEQRADDHVAAGLQPAVHLQRDARAQPFSTRICCVSASPISQGMPACLSEVSGLAPVPPS